MYSIEEKLQIIRDSSSLNDILSQNIMPDPDSGEGYYFVSYSHKDYKEVLTVILQLRELGIKIWYDRGLETGKSWSEEVKRRIFSYHCKGVMFFASERFFASDSTLQEYKMTVRCRKNFVIIDMTGGKMEEKIAEVTDPKASEFFNQYWMEFPTLALDAAPETTRQALLELRPPSLFRYTRKSAKRLHIKSINDLTIKDVIIPQYQSKDRAVVGLSDECFTNCIALESVTMPKRWSYIGANAFYNCKNLTRVSLGDPEPSDNAQLFLSAFTQCPNLKELTIPANVNVIKTLNADVIDGLERIVFEEDASPYICLALCRTLKEVINPPFKESVGDHFFRWCYSLEKADIPESCKTIGTHAFEECVSLPEITLPEATETVGAAAFFYCTSLSKLKINSHKLTVMPCAFYACDSLTEVIFPKGGYVSLHGGAFGKCENLQTVHFGGDAELDIDAFAASKHLTVVVIDGMVKCLPPQLPYNGIVTDYETLGLKVGDEKTFSPETVFPYATTFYIAAGADKFVPSAFKEVESDRAGYTKYVR